MMKHPFTRRGLLVLLSLLLCIFCFAACGEKAPADLWAGATYQTDTTLGEGAKTITVEVTAEEKTVVFTIKTDADTVGAALLEHNLIAGEEGAYGMYIKTVNGMLADYDVDGSWWSFYINGEMAMSGVDMTDIDPGAEYEFRKEK